MEDVIETIPSAHIYTNPYFVLGVACALILLMVVSRLIFTNTKGEYVYDPHME